MWKNTQERYGSLSIALHWIMVLLIAAVYACIELREFYPKGSDPREALKMWHFMLGLSVLVLVIIRIVVRLTGPRPVIVPALNSLQNGLARLTHLGLYLFMVAMPIAGWLILSAAGKPIPFFGLELPPLIDANKDIAGKIKEIHETAGVVFYYIIGLHALAALFHHYVQKDNTLTRMLPGCKK